MSAGDAGDPAGQQDPQDEPGPAGGQPQSEGQSQYGAQSQPWDQPPYGGYPQYGQPGSYGQSGGSSGPPSGGFYAPFDQGPYGPQTAWTPPRPTNALAIAALCCGIGQVIAGPLSGIPAIILGFMSMSQIERSGEQGRGMAITGAVLGIVGTVLFVLAILFVVAVVHSVQVNQTGTGVG